MTSEFSSFQLHPQLIQALTELGYSQPTPIQSAVIPLMLNGQDVIGQARTGTGKTAAFSLPLLQHLTPGQDKIQSLVLTPTRELALQVTSVIEQFGRYSRPRVLAVYGGQPYHHQINRLKKGVDVVVGTPGRILDLIQKNVLDIGLVKKVVLDEADEMLSMGFIEDIETILLETPPARQTALFSATMPPPVRRLSDRFMREAKFVTIQGNQPAVPAIEQRYYLVNESDKLAALTRLFEVEPITSALVFVRTRLSSANLAGELTKRGFPADALNGDLPQETREAVLRRFRSNQSRVLVATDVAARGLDIDDISHVFNYDLPDNEEVYVHRIGRTGRAGKSGIAITLVTPKEKSHLRSIEAFIRLKLKQFTLPTDEDILNHREAGLINQMNVWLKRSRYRRELELVSRLVEEGNDPLEVAAAALKIARADEKQRPIAPLSKVLEGRTDSIKRRGRSNYQQNKQKVGNVSHEPGMVRLTISKGRSQGIRPNDVVSMIASQAGIPGHSIGKIHIHDRHTLVDVPEDYLAQVLERVENYSIHKRPVTIGVAHAGGWAEFTPSG